MQECMNSKEKVLLDFLKGHYKATYEVMFLVPKKIYDETEIKDENMLDNLLAALCVRGYIAPNRLTSQNQMSKAQITLTEKALNLFNAEEREVSKL